MQSNVFICSRAVSQCLILQVMEPLSADAAEFWLNHSEYFLAPILLTWLYVAPVAY